MSRDVFRVGIVVPRFAPFRGGMETYVSSAAAALAAEGIAVTVITQAPRAAALPRTAICDGYTIERHCLPVGGLYDVPSPSAARAASGAGRFDVVWLHSYHTPLAWLAAEQVKTPIVFTPHYHGVGHTPIRRALHRVYRPMGRRLMASTRWIVVDTDTEAELVMRDFPAEVDADKIRVVPPAVADPTRGRKLRRREPNVVLTVARQENYKRTDLLVRAVVTLRERGVRARLLVVGDGASLDGYRELCARLGAQDVVTFTGAISDDRLADLWASASVYATASEQEAYGIGLAEALVAGLPVVASAIPAHVEVIRRAGASCAVHLCDPADSDHHSAARYADAIAQQLRAGGDRENRSAACMLPTPTHVVGQLLEVLDAARERAKL